MNEHVPDISILIVSWNTRDLLRACLASVFQHLGPLDAEVIVIDNASADGSAEMAARAFPRARVIANDENRGFAAANNQGIRDARGRFVLLLNPDTVVLGDVLVESVAYADAHPDVGVLGCQVMESEDRIQRTCFRFPSPLHTFLFATGLSGRFPRSRWAGRAGYGPWERTSERDVDVVSGMFMLVRREAIDDVGLMDEDYFVYAEETDWCYRIRSTGRRCVFAPVGRILHVDGGGKSTGQASVRMYVQLQKSLLLFHRKHLGPLSWMGSRAVYAISMTARCGWWALRASLIGATEARHKVRQSAAAARFHWTGREPAERPAMNGPRETIRRDLIGRSVARSVPDGGPGSINGIRGDGLQKAHNRDDTGHTKQFRGSEGDSPPSCVGAGAVRSGCDGESPIDA